MANNTKTREYHTPMHAGGTAAGNEIDYAIYRRSTSEPLDTLSLHVLARAYRTAWCVMFNCDPHGRHAIESLDLVIKFHRTTKRGGG